MQKLILTVAAFFFSIVSIAQGGSKDDLLKQRQQLKREIEQTEKALGDVKRTTKENLTHLNHINRIIDLQGDVIDNITGQLVYIEKDIYKSQREVNKLARVLDTLKQEY